MQAAASQKLENNASCGKSKTGKYVVLKQLLSLKLKNTEQQTNTDCTTPLQERLFLAPLRHAEKQQLYKN